MSLSNNLLNIKKGLPVQVTLVAVSKTKPIDNILELYNAGQRVFVENKIQELQEKYDALPKDIEWHMIGHIQTNKIKYMAPFVSLIHGVDREKVLFETNKQAEKNDRKISCLLQLHIAREDSKFGFSYDEARELLLSDLKSKYPFIEIKGLMGMASNVQDEEVILSEFESLNQFFLEMKTLVPANMKVLSMGMSGDYNLAIEKGSTMVRVGSAIFGKRNYNH